MIAKSYIYNSSSSDEGNDLNLKKKVRGDENLTFKKRKVNVDKVAKKHTKADTAIAVDKKISRDFISEGKNSLFRKHDKKHIQVQAHEVRKEDCNAKRNHFKFSNKWSSGESDDNLDNEKSHRRDENRTQKSETTEEDRGTRFNLRNQKGDKVAEKIREQNVNDGSINTKNHKRIKKYDTKHKQGERNLGPKDAKNTVDKILDELWYTKEEDEFVDSFYNMDKNVEEREKKMLQHFKTRKNNVGEKINQKNLDNNLWELNKLKQGGVHSTYNKLQLSKINEINSTNEIKKIVLTRDLNPPFMHKYKYTNSKCNYNNTDAEYKSEDEDGSRNEYKEKTKLPDFNSFEDMLRNRKKTESALFNVVKDETCDFVKAAKKGSEFLKHLKNESERSKARDRYWELENSKLGELLKIYKNAAKDTDRRTVEQESDVFDYKKEKKYGSIFNAEKDKKDKKNGLLEKEQLIKTKQSLPIYKAKQELLEMVYNNNIIIIVGETGSGKTTQIVQYLYEDGYHKNGIIGCTQPRRVAAVSVAYRVAYEMNVPIGELVGYTIRFEDVSSKNTKIRYVTDGILLRETLTDKELDKYSVIIMDEAHERSINTDVLFGILKNICLNRNDLKLIVTSATLDAQKFSDFFGNAPIFHIEGRTFHVRIEYLRTPCNDYIEAAVQKAIEIHVSDSSYDSDFGDILIFMTGQDDINATCYLLSERFCQVHESYKEAKQNKQKTVGKIESLIGEDGKIKKEEKENENENDGIAPFYIFPIYAQLSSEQQSKIFQKYDLRKIIVSTNIAETSLTLDGIKYVIDSGYCKLKVYNQKIGMDVLQITPISQANANQRSGRAGRTGPGICYRLYTENTFLCDMFENNIPEIQRSNLSNVVLLLKSLNVQNLFEFDFMDPPCVDSILNSLYELWILGAINNEGNLTELGEKMILFPLDPPLSKIVIYSQQFHCSDEILIIVSMLSSTSIFLESKENNEMIESKKEKFTVPESDHLTLLNIYLQWKAHNYSPSWCAQHFLQYKSLNKAKEVYSQLYDIFKTLKIKNVSCNNKWDVVRKTICSGYFHNAAKLKSFGEYINLRTNVACHVHPNCSLYNIGYTPDYVVYQEIVFTTKEFMRNVTTVDPEWLCELGPMFFYMKTL